MARKAFLGQVSDNEIRLLRVFRVVAECGGLSAAELELNIGRSTVSRHLKELEERLGLVLCRRGRAGFALTADGQRVYDGAIQLLEALEAFRNDVCSLHADLVGTLTLALFDKTVTNPQARIGDAVRRFREQAPRVVLDVAAGTTNDIEAGVIDGRFQVGVVPDHRRSDSLEYLELFAERMFLYCGRQHPLAGLSPRALRQKNLGEHDYAGLGFHSPNMEAAHRIGLRRQATVSDQEAVATLILSGCYVGFLPDHYAAAFVQAGLIERLRLPELTYDVLFVAITRRAPRPGRLAATFLDALRQAHAPAGLPGQGPRAS